MPGRRRGFVRPSCEWMKCPLTWLKWLTGASLVLLVAHARAQSLGGAATKAVTPAGVVRELQSLTLADAQRLAFQRNWDVLAAASGVDAAVAQKIVSEEFPDPTLSLSTSKINTDGQPNSTVLGNSLWHRSYDTIFAINQLFEIGGKRGDRQRGAAAGLTAARAQFYDARRTLDLAVTKAYAAVALAEENVRVLNQSAGTLRQEAQIAAKRFKAGDISEADKNRIEINADQYELQARSAESAAAQARVALENLLGIVHPQGDCVLADSLATLATEPVPPDTNHVGVGRPDVVAAQAAVRQAEAEWRLQRAERVPDPTVSLQYEHSPADSPNTVGLGVSFPLPIWNQNGGNIRAAQAALDQARLAQEKAEAQAAADVATARLACDEAVKRWQDYHGALEPKSAHIVKTVAYAYEKGGAALLDLLSAERDDNDVRLNAAQAASDAIVAIATLKTSMQVMPELPKHQ